MSRSDGDNVAVFGSFTLTSRTVGKTFTSPSTILATVRNGRVTCMQYMEDTLGTGSTFRSGGAARYRSDPAGEEIEF